MDIRSLHRPHVHLPIGPTTDRGRWAVALAIVSVGLTMAWTVIPLGSAIGFLAGVASGVVGAIAIVRDRDRGITVWLTLVPFLLVVGFVIGELVDPH